MGQQSTRGQVPNRGGASQAAASRPEPLLTLEQVSEWLGVPRGTLYQWRSRRRGPVAIKVGGGLRYRREDVDAYLDQHCDRQRN